MSTNPCPTAEHLARATSGALEAALHDHVAGCPTCQDALLVSAALRCAADDDAPLPDPRVLWLRGRSEARAAAARRVARLVGLARAAATAVLAAVVATVAAPLAPTVAASAARLVAPVLATPILLGIPLLAAMAAALLLVPPLVALADRVRAGGDA